MKYCYPNYKESTLNLINSILKYYNAGNTHSTLKILDDELKKDYKNVVLLLLDGLGDKQLNENSLQGILNENKVKTISSVFPSTTVAAVSTISSGLAPIEHGWLGWTLYFKEINRYINVFPYVDAFSFEKIEEEIDVRSLIKYKTIFQKINETNTCKAYNVHPDFIEANEKGTIFDVPYSNFKDMCQKLKKLTSDDGKKFIYAYSCEPDHIMHATGTLSLETNATIFEIEEAIKENLLDLKDTLIIVTADHGHIDIEEYIYIEDDMELFSLLENRPFVEGRATSFNVKNGKEKEFKMIFETKYKNDFILLSKNEAIKMKLFGPGAIHPKSLDFIGDYISLAISNKCFSLSKKKPDEAMLISMHAGLTTDEMIVPLIFIKDK